MTMSDDANVSGSGLYPKPSVSIRDEVDVITTTFSPPNGNGSGNDLVPNASGIVSAMSGASGRSEGGQAHPPPPQIYKRQPYHSNRYHVKDGFQRNIMPSYSNYTLVSAGATVSTMESNKVAEDLADFATNDPDSQKTLQRLFAEKVLMKFNWYYPNQQPQEEGDSNEIQEVDVALDGRIRDGANIPRPPSLKEGWAFFEHITLARHFVNESGKFKANEIERAEPGERRERTVLYNFFRTPGESLADWGIGVALYFNTIRVMCIALLLAGFVTLPNHFFYASERYSGVKDHQSGFSILQRGSAICNVTSWRECEDGYCNREMLLDNGFEEGVSFKEVGDKTFVQKSECDGAQLGVGIQDYAATIFLIVITLLFNWYQSKIEVIYDEDKVTTSDYSVRVMNPPPDATDPDEWHDFFLKYDDKGVSVITILLNNAPLLKALLARRNLHKEMQWWMPNTDVHDDELVSLKVEEFKYEELPFNYKFFYALCRPFVKCFNMFNYPDEIQNKLEINLELVKELQQEKYVPTDVIVTFETEAGQRLALENLSSGQIAIRNQRAGNRVELNLFRGEYLVDVKEPAEPSAMRYLDLDSDNRKCFIQQTITFSITISLVILGGMLVRQVRNVSGPFVAGLTTTGLNIIVPTVVRLLMIIEQHANEGNRQKSLYLKVTLFRWVNTVITAKIATPFRKILSPDKYDLITSMNAIFVSEMFTVPILSLLDIMGNLSKHYFAPRAKTVHQMNLCFKGTQYNLGEKYTDISKIVLLAYFYSALNPNFYFLGAVALFIRYYTEKFCMMRIYGAAPYIGTGLANFSRKYFFSIAIVIGAINSAYDWALFSFDRVCEGAANSTEPADYGDFDVSSRDAVRVCTEDRCCQQNGITRFPPVPGRFETNEFKWMTDEQKDLTTIYGWTVFTLIMSFLVLAFGSKITTFILSQFRGVWKPSGKDQKIDFSNIKGIDGYIPQIQVNSYPFPLLACDIDDVDQQLLGWNDPGISYDDYNMIFDVPYESMARTDKIKGSTRHVGRIKNHKKYRESSNRQDGTKPIFSIVKHWSLTSTKGNADTS